MELKNRASGQTIAKAVEQFKTSRSPQEDLYRLGRCAVHFAVYDKEVRFCTELRGNQSDLLPFNKGWEDGGSNPVNSDGIKSAYLWDEIFAPEWQRPMPHGVALGISVNRPTSAGNIGPELV